jgi:hypothetical protein
LILLKEDTAPLCRTVVHRHTRRFKGGTTPHSAKEFILPALTKVAWQLKGPAIRKDAPGITRGHTFAATGTVVNVPEFQT